jgi:adenosylmethionine-8-amino-7-oxononanoate aminotransferase
MPAAHVFFSQSGSEAIEAAMKLARQYHRLRGEPGRLKFISRTGAYHGTTMGALSLNGAAALRGQFEPLLAGMSRVDPPYPYRCEVCDGDCGVHSAEGFDRAIRAEGPESVAAVVIEPVQNSGGALVPPAGYVQRVREICDAHGVLLIVDETICAFGRVGEWFGSTRYGLRPDIVTTAKGLTSSWAPLAATIASERVAQPFFDDAGATFLHGSTFGGHPVSCAIALANLDIIEREGLLERVKAKAPLLRARCEALAERHPMIGEVRGDGFFIALELVKNRATREPFTHAERAELIADHLLPTVREHGVHMKFDDRIELAALFTPPLIAGEPEFELMVDALEASLDAAWATAVERMGARA